MGARRGVDGHALHVQIGPFLLHQHSRAVAQVLPHVCNHICPPIGSQHNWFGRDLPFHTPQFSREQIILVQFCQHLALRFGFTHPTRQQLRIGFIEMLHEFFKDGILRVVARCSLASRRLISGFQSDIAVLPSAFDLLGVFALFIWRRADW
jgi:hypothetical protein